MIIGGILLAISPYLKEDSETPVLLAQEISIIELYDAYEKNPLVADDNYKGNRYKFTGTIDSIDDTVYSGWYTSTDIVANIITEDFLFGDEIICQVTVTEDDKNYHLWCIFDEETQRDKLTQIAIGDTITIEGTCADWGNWKECELIK